jgi:hypothetical protein
MLVFIFIVPGMSSPVSIKYFRIMAINL